jgi:glutaredoxin
LELTKRAEELKERDIFVIIVHASMLEQAKLDEWIKENDILFPVGMIVENEEQTRSNWGVRSLPWLILTDKEHVVVAEGFSIDELNEKIMTLNEE